MRGDWGRDHDRFDARILQQVPVVGRRDDAWVSTFDRDQAFLAYVGGPGDLGGGTFGEVPHPVPVAFRSPPAILWTRRRDRNGCYLYRPDWRRPPLVLMS